MSRKHLFPLVVLLAAAAVTGLLALGRAADLGQPAGASTGDQPAIAFRLAKLDAAQKALHDELVQLRRTPVPKTRTVYQRTAAPVATGAADEHADDHDGDDDHGDDHEGDGERDD